MRYQYKTRGTCARAIAFDYENGVISNVEFFGGCNGNLKAISILVDGMNGDELVSKLLGNDCGGKGTSCADQLAKAVLVAKEQEANK
ncbi:MAG: TIGR03905 family TSCPD domain-containing protein [Lachnospiraceae bacterium]|nr:TIGR03905 family TSCPD domain-containing protein [Lachnospiraceae bacterium]